MIHQRIIQLFFLPCASRDNLYSAPSVYPYEFPWATSYFLDTAYTTHNLHQLPLPSYFSDT